MSMSPGEQTLAVWDFLTQPRSLDEISAHLGHDATARIKSMHAQSMVHVTAPRSGMFKRGSRDPRVSRAKHLAERAAQRALRPPPPPKPSRPEAATPRQDDSVTAEQDRQRRAAALQPAALYAVLPNSVFDLARVTA